jgi:molybdopterin synthase sulfur carrier subunit
MKVTVKYFASIREALGVSSESVDTTAVTLAALRDQLMAQSVAHAESLARGRSVRIAQNQIMCDESAPLLDGAEVAFFPPVTGG